MLCLRVIFIGVTEVLLHCTDMIYTERVKHLLMLSNICGLTLKKKDFYETSPTYSCGEISHKVTVSTQETLQSNQAPNLMHLYINIILLKS
jgi:hypothetical protein